MNFAELTFILDTTTANQLNALYAVIENQTSDRWEYEEALDKAYKILTRLADMGVISAEDADDVICELEEL